MFLAPQLSSVVQRFNIDMVKYISYDFLMKFLLFLIISIEHAWSEKDACKYVFWLIDVIIDRWLYLIKQSKQVLSSYYFAESYLNWTYNNLEVLNHLFFHKVLTMNLFQWQTIKSYFNFHVKEKSIVENAIYK